MGSELEKEVARVFSMKPVALINTDTAAGLFLLRAAVEDELLDTSCPAGASLKYANRRYYTPFG